MANKHLSLGGTAIQLSERPFFTKQSYGEDPIKNRMYALISIIEMTHHVFPNGWTSYRYIPLKPIHRFLLMERWPTWILDTQNKLEKEAVAPVMWTILKEREAVLTFDSH
jgi:hypothetical protein